MNSNYIYQVYNLYIFNKKKKKKNKKKNIKLNIYIYYKFIQY